MRTYFRDAPILNKNQKLVTGQSDGEDSIESFLRCIRVIEISNLRPARERRHKLPVFIAAQKEVRCYDEKFYEKEVPPTTLWLSTVY